MIVFCRISNLRVDVSTEDLQRVWEMQCKYILKETIDRKGNFYSGAP
jgi:hypothetical protein